MTGGLAGGGAVGGGAVWFLLRKQMKGGESWA